MARRYTRHTLGALPFVCLLLLCGGTYGAAGDLLRPHHLGKGGGVHGANAVASKGSRVFVAGLGHTEEGADEWVVRAYNKNTGELLWSDEFDHGGGASKARALAVKGKRLFVAGVGRNAEKDLKWIVRAYDTKTGSLLWDDQFDDEGRFAAPRAITVKGNRVFVVGTRSTEGTAHTWVVRAYSASTGALLWSDEFDSTQGTSDANAVAVKGSRVFAAGSGRLKEIGREWVVRAYDSKTGAVLWTDQFDVGGGDNEARAIAVKGNRVFAAGSGRRSGVNPLWGFTPVTNAEPFSFLPTDMSCCTRPEDGVGLANGAIVVGDRDSGLRYISSDYSSSRPFGKLPSDALVNGVSRDKHGFLIVTDIGNARVFAVDPETEETQTLFSGPASAVLNDAVRTEDGRVWVSLSTDGDLFAAVLEPTANGAIWRIDPTANLGNGHFAYDNAGAVVVASQLLFANGVLLDNDETYLYWAETTGNVIMKASIGEGGELGTPVLFAQIPFGGDNLSMDYNGNIYFANDWLTGVWAVDTAGIAFPIMDFRWSKTPFLIRAWANATNTPEDRLKVLEPDKRPPQFPRVPSTPFFVNEGKWLCLGTYETDLEPAQFNQLPCMVAPIPGVMK